MTASYDVLGWPVNVAEGGAPWVKANAVNPAVAASSADVVVIADADCLTDGLPEAVRAVELGAPWAKPHSMVHRLSRKATEALYGGEMVADYDQRPYQGVAGGGFIVARRETLLNVPMDPRFVGWGQEDLAQATALHSLVGPAWLGDADLIHLWHPPQQRLDRTWGSVESKRLLKRYAAAKRKPDRMRELMKEIHDYQPSDSPLHDPSP